MKQLSANGMPVEKNSKGEYKAARVVPREAMSAGLKNKRKQATTERTGERKQVPLTRRGLPFPPPLNNRNGLILLGGWEVGGGRWHRAACRPAE